MIKHHDPGRYYHDRLELFQAEAARLKGLLRKLAFTRLAVFLLTVILVYAFHSHGFGVMAWIAFAGVCAFLLTFKKYVAGQQALRHAENMVEINSAEIKVLEGDYAGFEDGTDQADPEHPFTSDLDIFGPGSLFQYLNRTAIRSGREVLAGWLKNPLMDEPAIRSRQEAVAEMAGEPDWRQEFRATGYMDKEHPTDKAELLAWVREPALFGHWRFRLFVILVPILTSSVILLAALSVIPPVVILLYHAVPFGIIGIFGKTILGKYRMLSSKSDIVMKYSRLLSMLEDRSFTSSRMQALVAGLHGKSGKPGWSVKKLAGILNLFEARNNMIVGYFLNLFFLWDIVMVRRLEKWQAVHRDELPRWLEILGETDALCSLSNFRFNHPESIFPVISQDDTALDADEICHPLISTGACVGNPANILCRRHFTIVTGANMAGKSTYLRTVGVNMVLAMAGSAVTAREMKFRPIAFVTSFLTTDSLQKNESYFYAELKRLKYIVERLENGERLVILLDEILKGTNSRDKQSGSIALIEKMLRYGASGMIATHDLALGELEKGYPGEVVNKSFEVVIEDDRLVFDYKLKDGIARQMNATFLMRKMGITD